jgi:hypothetical protein
LRLTQLLDQTIAQADHVALDLINFLFDFSRVKAGGVVELFNDLAALAGQRGRIVC